MSNSVLPHKFDLGNFEKYKQRHIEIEKASSPNYGAAASDSIHRSMNENMLKLQKKFGNNDAAANLNRSFPPTPRSTYDYNEANENITLNQLRNSFQHSYHQMDERIDNNVIPLCEEVMSKALNAVENKLQQRNDLHYQQFDRLMDDDASTSSSRSASPTKLTTRSLSDIKHMNDLHKIKRDFRDFKLYAARIQQELRDELRMTTNQLNELQLGEAAGKELDSLTYEAEIESYKLEIQTLRNRLNDIVSKQNVEEANHAVETLTLELKTLHSEKKLLETKLNAEMKENVKAVNSKDDKINHLQTELQNLSNELRDYKARAEDSENKLCEYSLKLSTEKRNASSYLTQLSNLKEIHDMMLEKQKNRGDEMGKLDQMLQSAAQERDELRRKYTELSQLENDHSQKDQDLQQLNMKVSELEHSAVQNTVELENLRLKKVLLEEKETNATYEMNKLQRKLNEVEKLYLKEKEANHEEASAKKSRQLEIQRKYDELQEEFKVIQSRCSQLETELQMSHSLANDVKQSSANELLHMKANMQSLKEKNEQLIAEYEELKAGSTSSSDSKMEKLNAKYKQVDAERTVLQSQLDSLNAKYKKADAEGTSLQSQLEKLTKQQSKLQEKMKQQQQRVDDILKDQKTLKAARDDALAHCSSLAIKLEKAEHLSEKLKKQVDSSKKNKVEIPPTKMVFVPDTSAKTETSRSSITLLMLFLFSLLVLAVCALLLKRVALANANRVRAFPT